MWRREVQEQPENESLPEMVTISSSSLAREARVVPVGAQKSASALHAMLTSTARRKMGSPRALPILVNGSDAAARKSAR